MYQVLPAPDGPRALFDLFALYVPGKGTDPMIDSVDFTAANEASIWAAFGHQIAERPAQPGYSPRLHFYNMLHSYEFRARARQLLLNAYPGKKRAIFVHIPKCAGSDLTALLRRRHPAIQEMLFKPTIPADELFSALRETILGLRYSNTIAVTGHERLAFYHRQHALVRRQDWFFTIVREPQALLYSHLSYILTICRDAPRTRRADGLEWLELLGLKSIPEHAGAAYMADLARALLANPKVAPFDTICGFLGAGSAQSALEAIVESNIEITDTARYPAWRAQRFPDAPASRENASHPYFTPEIATRAERDIIAARTLQDAKLYAAISGALDRADALSIRGRALA